MRCDLHVHTRYSGPVDLPGLRHLNRECYSEPAEVYETAKRRGMDLVTITDHDTIEGALALAHHDDFIVGQEVTCEIAPGREIHLGVWDLNESRHQQISVRRRDPEALFAWLAENRIPACVNHPFSPLTGRREVEDFEGAFEGVGLIETRNGMMPSATNEFAEGAGRTHHRSAVGGSDAHTLRGIGRTFTTVPGARHRTEFLEGLRAGCSIPGGNAGSYARLTSDVFRVFSGTVGDNTVNALRSSRDFLRFLATAAAVPLAGLIPLITLLSYARECWGGHAIYAGYRAALARRAQRKMPPFPGVKLARVSR